MMEAITKILRTLPFLNSSGVADLVLGACAGAPGAVVRRLEARQLRRQSHLNQVLVIADANIGDSILLQPAISALRARFPHAEIDYAFNEKTADLVGPDPLLRRSLPVLRAAESARPHNVAAIRAVLAETPYDLVINFCPFLTSREIGESGCPLLTPLSLTVDILTAYRNGEPAALPRHVDAYIRRLAAAMPPKVASRDPNAPFRTETTVHVPDQRIAAMRRFLDQHGFDPDDRILLINPDTSNRSTFLGGRMFTRLARRLIDSPEVDGIVLARAFKYCGIEHEILHRLQLTGHGDRIALTPEDLSLVDLAALVDCCTAYIGGDTGPLHVAAARKVSTTSGEEHRNRTMVAGLFKATDPRIYGYDSDCEDMIDSFQDAPAMSFEARPSCKNLTCSIQRITETCPARACHDAIDVDVVARSLIGALGELEPRRRASRQVVPFPELHHERDRAAHSIGERTDTR